MARQWLIGWLNLSPFAKIIVDHELDEKAGLMKPLVYYCRWQGAKLRLRGRDGTAVWGQLVFTDKDGDETTQDFHFHLKTWQLRLKSLEDEAIIQLDEMGVEVEPDSGGAEEQGH